MIDVEEELFEKHGHIMIKHLGYGRFSFYPKLSDKTLMVFKQPDIYFIC